MAFKHLRSLCILYAATSAVVRAQINADGAKPSDPPQQPAAPTPFVTTVTKDQSTYTITYAESTAASDTVVSDASTTQTVKAGEIVGAVVGGAAVGAAAVGLPLLIPKPAPGGGPPVPIPVDGGGYPGGGAPPANKGPGNNDDNKQCEKKEFEICKEECTKIYTVSECKIETTSSCKKKECSKTSACSAVTPSPVLTEPAKHEIKTASKEDPIVDPGDPGTPNQKVLEGEVIKILQASHLDFPNYSSTSDTNEDVKCEEDTTKENIEKKGIKVRVIQAYLFEITHAYTDRSPGQHQGFL